MYFRLALLLFLSIVSPLVTCVETRKLSRTLLDVTLTRTLNLTFQKTTPVNTATIITLHQTGTSETVARIVQPSNIIQTQHYFAATTNESLKDQMLRLQAYIGAGDWQKFENTTD